MAHINSIMGKSEKKKKKIQEILVFLKLLCAIFSLMLLKGTFVSVFHLVLLRILLH